jgi:galactose mutarotase-like enzyme
MILTCPKSSIVGRYGGRISNATFNLEGETYKLEANDGQHHIHGDFDMS